MKPKAWIVTLLPTLVLACTGAESGGPSGVGGAFVTLLGSDTVAVERFTRTGDGLRAELLVRIPRTTLEVHRLETGPDGGSARFERRVHDAAAGPDSEPLERQVMTFGADSVEIEVTEDGETETRTVEAGPSMVPFLEMTHWPYEVAIQRAVETGRDSLEIGFVAGRGPIPFTVARTGERSWNLSFFRGTVHVDTDGRGHVVRSDASETTRKLLASRVESVPFRELRGRYVERDRTEGPMGALSGRGEAAASVDGATVSVDYGRPSKRGREIFGALVPHGEVWRTGANRATHLTTDRALTADGTRIPAGTYTLWTIPGPGTWTLIVNEEIEIGGTSYDPSHDLARLEIGTRSLDETVETFTIEVEDTEEGGVLRLRWDRTEAYLPFRVGS